MRPSYYMDGVKVKKEVVQELLDDQKVTKDDTPTSSYADISNFNLKDEDLEKIQRGPGRPLGHSQRKESDQVGADTKYARAGEARQTTPENMRDKLRHQDTQAWGDKVRVERKTAKYQALTQEQKRARELQIKAAVLRDRRDRGIDEESKMKQVDKYRRFYTRMKVERDNLIKKEQEREEAFGDDKPYTGKLPSKNSDEEEKGFIDLTALAADDDETLEDSEDEVRG